jgi:hypothetical protein
MFLLAAIAKNVRSAFFKSSCSLTKLHSTVCPQTSHNIDCVLGSLCYIRPSSIWFAWQRSSPMKGELLWRGPNSNSKFDHHNINGGAVDDTCRHRWTTCKLNLLMRYLWVSRATSASSNRLALLMEQYPCSRKIMSNHAAEKCIPIW